MEKIALYSSPTEISLLYHTNFFDDLKFLTGFTTGTKPIQLFRSFVRLKSLPKCEIATKDRAHIQISLHSDYDHVTKTTQLDLSSTTLLLSKYYRKQSFISPHINTLTFCTYKVKSSL